MDKLKMHSPNLTDENVAKIRDLFPGCVTEARDGGSGELYLAVDFDQLRQELNDRVVEGPQERYQLNWPGKREALVISNAPTGKTLRPIIDESVNFESTRNLFIEGDNLEVLKLLQETYLGTIKMIYIDPPYNTGNDFIYDDDFSEGAREFLERSLQTDRGGNRLVSNPESNGRFHSDWLTMMFARLRLARKLLSEDGAIFIHIDEHEYPNLEKLLSEVFGDQNNIGTIVWDKRNPKGDATTVAQQHELISIYARDRDAFRRNIDFRRPKPNAELMMTKAASIVRAHGGVNSDSRSEYRKWLAKQDFSGGEKAYSLIDDLGQVYRTVSMAWPNKKRAPDEYFIPLVHPITGKNCPIPDRGWRNPPATMAALLKDGKIIFGSDEGTQPTRKYLLSENTKENIPSLLYFGGSDDAMFAEIGLTFDNPKPLNVAKKLIQSVCRDEDVVLDFFAGSSTTAHAVMELNAADGTNLKFIMAQLPEAIPDGRDVGVDNCDSIADISKERIRRAGLKVIAGHCHDAWVRDIGFRVLKVDTSNMQDVFYRPDATSQGDLLAAVDNVKPGRKPEDLLFQVLVDWGVDLTLPIRRETVHGKTVFFVDDNALAACFDSGVTEELVKDLAGHQPLRMVFRDNGFASDAVKINVEQIFRQLSPNTDIKSI
jgi:adenine-specific DNA-methyltransferase